jgi:hypothetical protein
MLDTPGKLISRKFSHHPIFIVGAGRSGTSILVRAMGAHPMIYSVGGESPYVSHIANLVVPLEFGDQPDYYETTVQVPKDYLYGELRDLIFKSVTGRHFGTRIFLRELGARKFGYFKLTHWCAKSIPDYDQFRGLLRLFPDAKFVYIARSGYDVIQSRSYFHAFRHQGFETHCQIWSNLVHKYAYLLEQDEAVFIRHEDLVAKPDQVFGKVFSSLGIADDPGPAAVVGSTIVHPRDQKTKDNVDVGKIFKERKPAYMSWTEDQKATFKSICAEAMGILDYDIPF